MTGRANRPGAAPAVCLLLLVGAFGPAGRAEDFTPRTAAEEQVQSRRYQADDPGVLLRASLAVLQDIRFLVTHSEADPPLLVAQAPSRSCACTLSLTVSIQPVGGERNGWQVRLTATMPTSPLPFIAPKPVDHTDFYQDFFSHLDRELFKRRPS
jgi:hypothetical protein